MKNKATSLLCLILALCMALSLAACGGEGGGDKNTADKDSTQEHPEFLYVPEFKKVDIGDNEYISFLSADENKIYCAVEKIVGENIPEGAVKEYEDQFAVYAQSLCVMDENGKFTELPGYEIVKAEDTENRKNYNGSSYIVTAMNGADNQIIVIESVSASWFEGPEGIEYASDEYWEYQKYEEKYICRVLNSDGSEISSFPLTIPENSYIGMQSVAMDKEGNIVLSADMTVQAYNTQGEIVYEFVSDDTYIERILSLSDGRLFAFCWGDNGPVVREIDGVNKNLGEAQDMPKFTNEVYPGSADYELCYTSGINFYGFNLGQEPQKLFSWIDADINSDAVRNLVVKADGSIAALCSEWDETEEVTNYEMVSLNKKPYESVPHKEELSLAVMWLDYNFKDSIIKYNRTNDKYRVVIKDYSEFNTEDDWEAGKTKLITEIMSGEMPDMLCISGLPYTQLLSKGIIEDIYPFIDADPDFSREDFQPNLFKALEVDGKLGQVCSSFSVLTAAGAPQVVGTEPGWNYQQFTEALAQMPEGCMPFGPYVSRADMLRMALSMDMDLYADWSTGECRFDSPEFAELLKFAAGFPEAIDFENMPETDQSELFATGMQMLSAAGIGSFDDLQYNEVNFGGNCTYIGFPSASGNGSAFQVGTGYAITKNCSNKEAAWDFLRTLLTEEYQTKNNWYGLPTNLNVFDKKLKDAMTPEYQKDMNGNYILDEDGEKIPVSHGGFGMPDGTVVEFYSVSQEQADKLMKLLDSTQKLMDDNSKLTEIILEDAQAFFQGQKSVEEVCKLIQSKVNIYINEQR